MVPFQNLARWSIICWGISPEWGQKVRKLNRRRSTRKGSWKGNRCMCSNNWNIWQGKEACANLLYAKMYARSCHICLGLIVFLGSNPDAIAKSWITAIISSRACSWVRRLMSTNSDLTLSGSYVASRSPAECRVRFAGWLFEEQPRRLVKKMTSREIRRILGTDSWSGNQNVMHGPRRRSQPSSGRRRKCTVVSLRTTVVAHGTVE